MDYKNLTPFPSLAFDSLDVQGQEFHVAVLRMTLDIGPEGQLTVAKDQAPLVFSDEFQGESFKSSVKQESDLAPYKPWCDVIVIGAAHAPGGKPLKRFEAGIRITRKGESVLNKQVTITGPRYWINRFARGWTLTEPEPIQSLPLCYEYAYGGECRIEAADPAARKIKAKDQLTPEQRAQHPDGLERAPIAHACAPANPLGRGYAAPWYIKAKKLKRIPAPQIESPFDPIKKFDKAYIPQSLGVYGRAWSPRLELSGTIDAAFVKSGRSLPADFDFAYWNGAHPDMQVPWLHGDETVDLINIPIADLKSDRIDSQGNRITRLVLPGGGLSALAQRKDGLFTQIRMAIDTLIVDAVQKTVAVVCRAKIPVSPAMRSIDLQFLSSEQDQTLNNEIDAVNEQLLAVPRVAQ